MVVARDPLRDPPLPRLGAPGEVRAHQLLLAAERAVQRRLGHSRALDHAVDPDRMYALGVEQLGRSGQQPVARRPLQFAVRHAFTVQTGLSIVKCIQTDLSVPFQTSFLSFRGVAMRLSRPAAFVLQASIILSFLAGSSAPTPLYAVYQAAWGFSPVTVTFVFGIYALAVLVALLVAGALSDHVGRRPVLFAATVLQAVTMIVFATADGVGALIIARVLQGLATGAAAGAVG